MKFTIEQSDAKNIFILVLISILFFFVGNNIVALTDPDEVFYSLTAKEMLLRHEWLTPYIFGHPQFEKPIFTYWLLVLAFKIGGVTPWAARFFPALFATFSVVGIYVLTKLIYIDRKRAFFAGLVLATSAIFVGMGKTVFTDMVFTTLILYAILSFYLGYAKPNLRPVAMLAFYFFGALATLTKGPLGYLIPECVVILFLLYRRRLDVLMTPWVGIGFALGLVVALPWYLYIYQQYGSAFINEFFYNDHWRRLLEAEHRSNDRWFFYPLSMIAGVFPFSFFLVVAIKDLYKRLRDNAGDGDYLILSWIMVVFIIFQCAHSKLVSYILPLFPVLALLTADALTRKISKNLLIAKAVIIALIGAAAIIVPEILAKKIHLPMLPIFWVSAGLITLASLVYCAAISGRERLGLYFLSGTVMVVLVGGWFAKDIIEDNASCEPASVYLPHQLPNGQRILTSKPYARGISFYTDLPVAVYDPGGKGYFSPHPIPSFSDDKQLSTFLDTQPMTYAYLKKNGFEHISKAYSDRFTITVIKQFGTNRLVKIEPLPKS